MLQTNGDYENVNNQCRLFLFVVISGYQGSTVAVFDNIYIKFEQ